MIHNRIEGTTRVLGKSQGFTGLHVRDVTYTDGTHAIQHSWSPTPDELVRLNSGKSIIITQSCVSPPPIHIAVPE